MIIQNLVKLIFSQFLELKKIAGPHLERAWSEIPHVTQHDEADITEMEKFRKTLRDFVYGRKNFNYSISIHYKSCG